MTLRGRIRSCYTRVLSSGTGKSKQQKNNQHLTSSHREKKIYPEIVSTVIPYYNFVHWLDVTALITSQATFSLSRLHQSLDFYRNSFTLLEDITNESFDPTWIRFL